MVVDSKSAVNESQETIDWTVAGGGPTLSPHIKNGRGQDAAATDKTETT
jgi:hypothetical protein